MTHWGEAEADVEIVPNSVNKIVVKFAWRWVNPFEFFSVVISGVSKESFFFVLSKQARNLTSREDHADVL